MSRSTNLVITELMLKYGFRQDHDIRTCLEMITDYEDRNNFVAAIKYPNGIPSCIERRLNDEN